jgi:Family of unknown function (DUF6049)
MTRYRAVLLAIVIALTVGWVPPSQPVSAATPGATPASGAAASPGAEPAPAAAPKPRIATLAGQTPFARPDETMQLSLDLAGPPDGLEVQVLVHRAVTSRTEFTQTQGGRGLGGVEGRLSAAVPDLTQNAAGQRVVAVGVQGPASATGVPDPTRIVPGRSGIYPTEVMLLRSGTVVDSFVTPLVVIAAGLSPLTLSWVWRFDATPAHQPDGTIRRAAGQAMGPSGRLVRLAQAAATAGAVPLTVAPTPETLAAWQEVARQEEHQPGGPPADGASAGLAALKSAVTAPAHQLLRSPYVPVDTPGLLSANLAGEIDAEFARGAGDQQQILGTAPAPTTLLTPGPLNSTALGRLRQYGAERLVLPPAALQPRDQRLTPGRPFVVGSRGKPYPAAVSDPDLSRVLEGDDPPALRAARFLAALSLVALEAPGEPRGVVVVSPEEWDPPVALLDAVLGGLQNNPAVVPSTLDGYFANVTPEGGDGRPVVRDLASSRASDPGDADTIRSLRRQLAGFASVVEPGSPWLDTADRTILLSRAAVLQADNRAERKLSSPAGYLEGASRQLVKNITSKVRGPKGQRVTLTSRRSSIPISLLNATGRPLQVRVRLESDQLRFLDGAERFVTLASQNTTERFRVESRTTGAFPLEITVTSPDGSLKINSSELTIRSTVVSGVGAVLTAGAGLFLLVWWGNDLRRSRYRRNGRARRQGRMAAKAAARALDDAERVAAGTG